METIYYTPQEVAERLKLRVQTIYDYIRQGRLPAVRLGNRCRIAASDLELFLERHKKPARSSSGTAERDMGGQAHPVSPRGDRPGETKERGETNPIVSGDLRDQKERNEALRRQLAEWMADESGYDERVWPIVEKLLAENPVFV